MAWAESGAGPVIVKAANWLTHLEFEWESAVWRHWIQLHAVESNSAVQSESAGVGRAVLSR